MIKTADTKFNIFYDNDTTNAYVCMETNTIDIGCKTLTLETIVHEISELEMEYLLKEMGYINLWINKYGINDEGEKHFISHLMSPYGLDSLIEPAKYTYEETFKKDFDVSKYEEVLI